MTSTARRAPAVHPVLRRHRHWLYGGIATLLFLALAVLASLPTGSDSAADAVAGGSRLAASTSVDGEDVVIQVLSGQGRLSVQVAYEGPKGWLGVGLAAVTDETVASWAATGGSGPVPALSIVYGRAPGDEVAVTWDDGDTSTVTTESDGTYVVARPGRHGSASVSISDADGSTVLEVDGP